MDERPLERQVAKINLFLLMISVFQNTELFENLCIYYVGGEGEGIP